MQPNESSSIRAGLFVIVSGVVIIMGIVALGQRSQFLARKYMLKAEFRNALGLIPGADVRVAGVNAGAVRSVEVVTAPGSPAVVEVMLEINRKYQNKIRHDSSASIRTLGPLGDKYVEISLGSIQAGELPPDSQISTNEAVDFYEIADEARQTFQRASRIAEEITATLSQIDKTAVIEDLSVGARAMRKLIEEIEGGSGLAHALVFDPEIPAIIDDLRVTTEKLRALVERVEAGEGGLGEIIQGEKLAAAVRDMADITGSAREILKEIEKGSGTAHALVYESDFQDAVSEMREATASLNAILAQIKEKKGTLGLLIADSGVWESLTRILGGAEESRVLKVLVDRAVRSEKKRKEAVRKE